MRHHILRAISSIAVALAVLSGGRVLAGTEFTYQGQLTLHNTPVTATCSMQFRLFNSSTGGALLDKIGPKDVTVTGGVFTALLDFGADKLGDGNRWLEISTDCGTGLIQLAPRQALKSTPYAVRALRSNSPSVRVFNFQIRAIDWGDPAHYGDQNVRAAYAVPASRTGGKKLEEWWEEGAVIIGYVESFPMPYSIGTAKSGGGVLGIRIDLWAFGSEIQIAQTTNGWKSLNIIDADLPSTVNVRIVVIDPS